MNPHGKALVAVAAVAVWIPVAARAHSPSAAPGKARAAATDTSAKTTLQQRLVGGDPRQGFSFLTLGPGEPYVVREELATAKKGRAQRRRSLVYMTQLTDFQLSDEESPARVEFLDDAPGGATSSAWRPQEALVAHQVEYTIRQVNRFLDSPVPQGDGSRARMLNAVLTGDLADNAQRNETEWVVRLLEGGTLNPNSGSADVANGYDAFCQAQVAAGNLDPAEAPRYTGVQDYSDYFKSPLFYDPNEPFAIYADRSWPTYTGLLDRAQQPFAAEGLRVPSYVQFGNHDSLAQGNEDMIAPFEAVGVGCVKPLAPAPVVSTPLDNLDPAYLLGVAADPQKAMLVPPDPNRQYVDKRQFKKIHDTGAQDDQHGFAFIDPQERDASDGAASHYAFTPKRGIRYIVLDTVADAGNTADIAQGNLDDPQWRWLERELDAAEKANQVTLVFGHHATGSMGANTPDEAAARCTSDDAHGHDVNPGCDRDPRASTPLHHGDELEALLHAHPHVVAYIAGHSHESRIAPLERERGGFWEIKSPAVVDWPPQHRLVEVMNNEDGTLSIFGTILDHEAPAAAPRAGDASSFDPATLASLGRVITYNDPQVGPGLDGEIGPEGEPSDRNVELLIADPRRAAARPRDDDEEDRAGEPRRRPREQRADSRDEIEGGDDAPAPDGGDDLPFTGFALLAVAGLGVLLSAAGVAARRRTR